MGQRTLCACRSTAAESYLKGDFWHVPDKPAAPVGKVGRDALHNLAANVMPANGKKFRRQGRCSGIRDSSQPGSGRLCRALHSAAVPVAGTVAQGAVWQMQGAEFGVGTQSEEEYKSGMYASKQQV